MVDCEEGTSRTSRTGEEKRVCTLFLPGTRFVHWSIRDDIVRCATLNLVVRRGAFKIIIWSAS